MKSPSSIRLPLFVVFAGAILFADAPLFGDIPPAPAEAQRRKGGEAFPPLPLPATPLRRTEKKRPPAAPVLIARLRYGKPRQVTFNGQSYAFDDWNTDEGAVKTLLKEARAKMGIAYSEISDLSFAQVTGDPSQIPILYLTGHVAFSLSEAERAKLKAYMDAGGFLWGEACCGEAEFGDSFRALLKTLYPRRELTRLPMDHPVFKSFSAIETVTYSKAAAAERADNRPELWALELGDRAAAIFSPYDLSCGWDNHNHESDEMGHPFRAVLYDRARRIDDAKKLGLNMIAYCLAYHQLGRALSETKIYYEQEERARGDFVFGQLVHRGNWDPDPDAAANLLAALKRDSSARVKFQRRAVTLLDEELGAVPFLYLTGHEDFVWSSEEAARLRSYLANGGFLLADACCGRRDFALAFRREIARALPEHPLAPLPSDHEVFSALHVIDSAEVTPLLAKEEPGLAFPLLEGVELEGATRVFFSRHDLGNGWEGIEHPFTRGYLPATALKLGVNVIVYSMTH